MTGVRYVYLDHGSKNAEAVSKWLTDLGVDPNNVVRDQDPVAILDGDSVRLRVFLRDNDGKVVLHQCRACDDWHASKHQVTIDLNGHNPEDYGLVVTDVETVSSAA